MYTRQIQFFSTFSSLSAVYPRSKYAISQLLPRNVWSAFNKCVSWRQILIKSQSISLQFWQIDLLIKMAIKKKKPHGISFVLVLRWWQLMVEITAPGKEDEKYLRRWINERAKSSLKALKHSWSIKLERVAIKLLTGL